MCCAMSSNVYKWHTNEIACCALSLSVVDRPLVASSSKKYHPSYYHFDLLVHYVVHGSMYEQSLPMNPHSMDSFVPSDLSFHICDKCHWVSLLRHHFYRFELGSLPCTELGSQNCVEHHDCLEHSSLATIDHLDLISDSNPKTCYKLLHFRNPMIPCIPYTHCGSDSNTHRPLFHDVAQTIVQNE